MQIPSMTLWTEEAISPEKRAFIPETVFADLDFHAVFPDFMLRMLGQPASAEDIGKRQEVFRLLLRDEGKSREKLVQLTEQIAVIHKIHETMNRYDKEVAKDIIFVTLAGAVRDYVELSASLDGDAAFLRRYTAYFVSIRESEDYLPFQQALTEIQKALDTVRLHTLREKNGRFYLTPTVEEGSDVLTSLISCIRQMEGSDIHPPVRNRYPMPIPIVESLARLHPELFASIAQFRLDYAAYIDGDTVRCQRECRFYLEGIGLADRLTERGIAFCFPRIASKRMLRALAMYDISLLHTGGEIVPNDGSFDERDSFFFLTGANGGGKTTYLRTVGLTLILFLSGCPTPCRDAEIYPFLRVLTHFPRDERYEGMGRLVDEKNRADEILEAADSDAFLLLNETFSGTDERKSEEMTEAYAMEYTTRHAFGIYVTHIHSVADTNIPMLNVVVDTDCDNRRTFKVIRRESVRNSYAYDILKKYGLTQEQLASRTAAQVKEENV